MCCLLFKTRPEQLQRSHHEFANPAMNRMACLVDGDGAGTLRIVTPKTEEYYRCDFQFSPAGLLPETMPAECTGPSEPCEVAAPSRAATAVKAKLAEHASASGSAPRSRTREQLLALLPDGFQFSTDSAEFTKSFTYVFHAFLAGAPIEELIGASEHANKVAENKDDSDVVSDDDSDDDSDDEVDDGWDDKLVADDDVESVFSLDSDDDDADPNEPRFIMLTPENGYSHTNHHNHHNNDDDVRSETCSDPSINLDLVRPSSNDGKYVNFSYKIGPKGPSDDAFQSAADDRECRRARRRTAVYDGELIL